MTSSAGCSVLNLPAIWQWSWMLWHLTFKNQNMLMEMAKEEVGMLLGVSGDIDNLGTKLGDHV
jgi:hypothetical protein